MLAKRYRLTTQDFKRVGEQKPTRVIKGPYCGIKAFLAAGAYPRFGVVVGTKIDKRAVVRNRIKRTLYDFFRLNLKDFPAADYVCVVYPPAAKASREQLRISLGIIKP